MAIALLVFLASGAAIFVAGTALANRADRIAEETRLGRVWIGSILLAGATSLPELTTDISAVRLGVPDLAAGDLFGSSLANMMILAVIDLVPPRGRVLRQATFDHALSACLAIVLNSLAAVFVLASTTGTFLGVGIESTSLALIYLAGTRAVYRHSLRDLGAPVPLKQEKAASADRSPLRRAILGFAAATVVILAAAPAFAWSAKEIAEITGLGTTFIGTVLVGFSTSLPELVASLAAVRIGAFDLAVGNLFGSNCFNMLVFFAMDLAHPGGNIFSALEPVHAVTAIFSTVLMSLGLAGIVYRAERRFAMIEPGSVLMLVTYLLGLWLLYTQVSGGN